MVDVRAFVYHQLMEGREKEVIHFESASDFQRPLTFALPKAIGRAAIYII